MSRDDMQAVTNWLILLINHNHKHIALCIVPSTIYVLIEE